MLGCRQPRIDPGMIILGLEYILINGSYCAPFLLQYVLTQHAKRVQNNIV